MRWSGTGMLALGAIILAIGAGVAAVGCALPLVRAPDGPRAPPQATPALEEAFRGLEQEIRRLEVSVLDLARPAGDEGEIQVHLASGPRGPSWPARLVLATAAAAVALAGFGRPRAAWALSVALTASIVWLFFDVGADHLASPAPPPAATTWAAYPPLSAVAEPVPLPVSWWTWAALVSSALLVAASAKPLETGRQAP